MLCATLTKQLLVKCYDFFFLLINQRYERNMNAIAMKECVCVSNLNPSDFKTIYIQ